MSAPGDPSRKQQRDRAREERKAQEAAAARAAARKKRLGVVGAVVAAAVVLVVALVALSSPEDAKTPVAGTGEVVPGQAATASLLAGIPQQGRVLGSPKAPVTLVEFADLQCPFCRQYTEDALPTVISKYVRTGKVRLEFRPRTFIGADSVTAARTVLAAGRQDKLWNTLELVYANQGEEESGWYTPALQAKILRGAGVDAKRVAAAAPGAEVSAELKAADLLATRNGLQSTPSFLIGPTGGTLKPLEVQALTGAFFSSALDQALPAS